MPEHPIEGLMKTTMANLKEMVDVNTIVGDAVYTPDGTVIIPVSKISFGFASGGSEFNKTRDKKMLLLKKSSHLVEEVEQGFAYLQ